VHRPEDLSLSRNTAGNSGLLIVALGKLSRLEWRNVSPYPATPDVVPYMDRIYRGSCGRSSPQFPGGTS